MGCLYSCFSYLRECWENLCAFEPYYGNNPWVEILGTEAYFAPNPDSVQIELSDVTGTGMGTEEAGPEDYLSLLPEDVARRILSMLDDASLMRASMAFETWGDICRRDPALRVRIQDQLIEEAPRNSMRGITALWRHMLFLWEAVEPPRRVRWADLVENEETSDPRSPPEE